MKNTINLSLIFIILISTINNVKSQEDTRVSEMQVANLKLELLQSRLEILESEITKFEDYPAQIHSQLSVIADSVNILNNRVDNMNKHFNHISNNLIIPAYSSSITVNMLRLMESTMDISFEKVINRQSSINISAMLTYSTRNGFSGNYLMKQDLEYFDSETNNYSHITGDMLSGFGINTQWRKYLLSDIYSNFDAPIGLYAGTEIMFRKIWITGKYVEYINNTSVENEVTQKLDILSTGLILGYKLTLFKVLAVDVHIGGGMRMSHYENEKGLTKYKRWRNIDYSGVMPSIGINIGIMQ